jgi:hypothetical protein
LDESEILEQLETMCDYEKPVGKWMTRYDLVEEGSALKLVDMGRVRNNSSRSASSSSRPTW